MKTQSKIFAAVLSCIMICTALPLSTFANAPQNTDADVSENAIPTGPYDLDLTTVSIVSEDVFRRTEREKHFALDNGTSLVVQYNQPVHMSDGAGGWADIENPFILQAQATDDALVSLNGSEDAGAVSFTLSGFGTNTVSAETPEVFKDADEGTETVYERNVRIIEEAIKTSASKYKDIFTGVDILCSTAARGFNQNIIINQEANIYAFPFTLKTQNATVSESADGSIDIKDETGTLQYVIQIPYMQDGAGRTSDAVNYSLTKEDDGRYIFTITADSEWIQDSDTTFPVTVVSDITQAAENTDDIAAACVSSNHPDATRGGSYIMKAGKDSGGEISRTYLAINQLPALTESDIMLSAKLRTYSCYTEEDNDASSIETEAHLITEPWHADTVTWNSQPVYAENTLDSTICDGGKLLAPFIEWDITKMAGDWYDHADTYGIALVSSDETNGECTSYLSPHAAATHPYVLINYFCTDGKSTDTESASEQSMDENVQQWENTDRFLINEETNTGTQKTATTNRAASTGDFKEVNDLTFSFYSNGKWNTSADGGFVGSIDGIRILTGGKPYYFRYKTRNDGRDWQSPVLSTSPTDYAGLYNYPVTNLAIEVYEGSTRIYDNYVVMYRAKVAGEWLDWVSNGDSGIMKSIQQQFDLAGGLDVGATNAGWNTRGNIQALDIRVYERTGYSGNTSSEKQFQEITDFTQEYYVNRGWNPLSASITVDHMDGVRLGTNSKDFFLKYNSTNAGKGELAYVYSTNSNDYAGWPEYPMTNLAIAVYNSANTRIYDDYVVMYRAKVAGEWLDWVSNGRPDVMRTIQYEYNLSGGLDPSATDAGWSTRGNIQAVEIRIFERISDGSAGGSAGSGDFQTTDSITMEYYKNRTWYDLTSAVSVDSMDGVRLQSRGKPYYLWYRSKDAAHGFLAFVSSENSGANDYAGWPGFAMTNLEIQVYLQGGIRIYDDYVVMYRAKVAGHWLDWVSNGNPDVMQGIQKQFGLDGGLDTRATDAGDNTQGVIQALDIRVYERSGLIPQPSQNAKIIDAPYINQNAVGMPNGCESVSTVMALQYMGVSISAAQFVEKYLDMGTAPYGGIGSDPNKVFVGDPRKTTGWGCYAPVILKALNKFIAAHNLSAVKLTNQSLDSLCSTYIDKNVPVVLWATVGMTDKYAYRYWKTPEGTDIVYNNKLHCLLLVGYDENYYYFNDPLANMGSQKYIGYPKARVQTAYTLLGKQAVVITNNDPGGIGTETNPGNPESPVVVPDASKNISAPTEIDIYGPPIPDDLIADPIDLSTGAHVIDHTLMTVTGAQTLSFKASYKSNLLTEGEMGTGWSHNFEKSLVDEGTTIKVYDNPTYYAVYKKASGSSIYTTETITKENYTVEKTSSGYTVNCNSMQTEYYDAAGRLTKITGKSGFDTRIEYSGDIVKITDAVSGRYIKLEKDSSGKVVHISDNSERSCTLGYTGSLLTSVNDENGNTISYQYNANNQIERGMDAMGTIYFTDTYDDSGRVISQQDAVFGHPCTLISYDDTTVSGHTLVKVTDRMMHTSVYKYNEAKQLVSKTDANGIETKYAYDAAGNLTKKTDGLGNSVVNTYDPNNNLTSVTNERGKKTKYVYDARNNLTKIEYPDGGAVTNTYDAKDRLVTSTDLRGITTKYEYDAENLLVKKTYSGRVFQYTYQNGQAVGITDPLGRQTTNQYSSAGLLLFSKDAQNHPTRYTYDAKGNLLTVTDAAGNTSSKVYDANGNVVKSTDADGNTTAYAYNGNMKMTSMTLPTGATILYEYDGEDRLTCITYPDGKTDLTKYDAAGRAISKTDKDGNTVSYTYDAAGNIVKITDAIGGITRKEYDAAGNITKSTEVVEYKYMGYDDNFDDVELTGHMENSTSYQYDACGRLTQVINALGGKTVYAYNLSGDLLSVTDPVGNTTTNKYDAYGNLLIVTDPRGNITTYAYDLAGNLLSVKDALGQITTNTYDSLNRLSSATDPGGHTVTYGYDELGRQTSRTDARGYTTHQYYDAMGNVIRLTDESNNIDFEAVYDEGGRAVRVTDAAKSVTYNQYDWAGNLTQQIDAMNGKASYTYNGAGQMIRAVDRAGGVSYATYDGMGNITSMTGPGGSYAEYTYDTAGRTNKTNTVVDNYNEYRYNALGLIEHIKDGNYYDIDYSYDAAGRITSIKYYDDTVYYTYDNNGNVLTARDNTGTVRREYDALNRVTKYTDIYDNVIQYEYDACGNLIKMVYPTGESMTYSYDANHNMLSSATADDKYVTTYQYNAQNQITKINNIDGSTVTKSYDSAGRLQLASDKDKNGKIISTYIYTYDALGRILTELDPITKMQYKMTYDSLGRLTKRTECEINTDKVINEESYTYDPAGNILSDENTDGTVNTYAFDKNNYPVKVNGKRYSVDSMGSTSTHTLENGRNVYVEYDKRNRLKRIDGSINEYWYDVDNNRINMYYYHTNIKYTYDCSGGRSRLLWTSDHNYAVTSYAYGADGLIWSVCDGNYRIYHYDYRGSVVAVTDIDGNVTDTVKYNAYGGVAQRTGDSDLIFGYNGRDGVLTDPNGLLYMRNRYYNPDLKRFMSTDIIDGSIGDSTSLNLYAFVNGNPISFIDPFGLSAERGQESSNNYPLGGIPYGGTIYPIYVPNHLISTVEKDWKTVDYITKYGFNFEGLKFLLGIDLEDFNGENIYAGNVLLSSGYLTNKDALEKAGTMSLFMGALNSAMDSLHTVFVNFEFQECGDERRVIISAGSSDAKKMFSQYAGGSHSMYLSNGGNGAAQNSISSTAGKIYRNLTGNKLNILSSYDINVTVDKLHKDNPYSSYLWIAGDGTVMESPIIYPGDKVDIYDRGFWGFKSDFLVSVPLGGSSPIAPEYQTLFNKYIGG